MPVFEDNIEELWEGTIADFPLVRLGADRDRHLYVYFQPRPGEDESWAGMETFKRPPEGTPVSWGYGYYPGRLWSQNFVQEAGGEVACREVFAQRVYFARPQYRDLSAPEDRFIEPDHYDEQGIPYTREGDRLGGIHFLGTPRDAYVERQGDGDLRFVSAQVPSGITLSQIAQALERLGIIGTV